MYPNEEQKILLERHFGSCRFVWNHFLEVRNKYHAEHRDDKKRGLTGFDTMKMLTSLKKDVTWLNEINSQSLQRSLVKLDTHSSPSSGTIPITLISGQGKITSILSCHQVLGQMETS